MSKGKIFSESLNIHQDKARVLYEYLYRSAEKIVAQEVAIEKEIADIEAKIVTLEQEKASAALWKWILCILIIPFIINHLKEQRLGKEIDELRNKIAARRKDHQNIFRGYKVNRLGVAYVPVARQIRFNDRTFIIDYTGQTPKTEVKLQVSRQSSLLVEKVKELEELSRVAPLVETSQDAEEVETDQYSSSMQKLSQNDYFGALDRNLRTISYCMDDLEVSAVELPLVSETSPYFGFLKEYAAQEANTKDPVLPVFDAGLYEKDVAKFEELNKLKDSLTRESEEFEDVLKKLMTTMASSVQAITSLKVASVNKLVMETNSFLYTILKSPYNHYSPTLEAEEIERIGNESFNYYQLAEEYVPFRLRKSSQMRYNLLTGDWIAEDGSTATMPFGVHQLYEEIVAPTVQALMQENRLERLKIYNHIKDQKLNYLNQWHKEMMDFYGRNRAESSDLINLMRASLREFVSSYNTLESLRKTEESMSKSEASLDSTVVKAEENSVETFAAFEHQSAEFQAVQADFEKYMDQLKDDIDFRAAKFEHIEFYDAALSDQHFRDASVAMNEMNDLDARRRPLALVNPLFARGSELLPTPSFEGLVDEHFAINLPAMAKNSLRDLENAAASPEPETPVAGEAPGQPEQDDIMFLDEDMPADGESAGGPVANADNSEERAESAPQDLADDELEFLDDEIDEDDPDAELPGEEEEDDKK